MQSTRLRCVDGGSHHLSRIEALEKLGDLNVTLQLGSAELAVFGTGRWFGTSAEGMAHEGIV